MERLLCDICQCQETAIKFCFNCKSFLCRLHRTEDIKEQRTKGASEHYYIDALRYRRNESKFSPLYCKEHPNHMLIRRCVNCFQFACVLCLPHWCTKAGGRYHDFKMMKNLASSYKDKVSELQMRLQEKHQRFLLNLKEACRTQDRIESELQKLLNEIDRAVESHKAAVNEESEKLKEEIVNEMFHVSSQITGKIQSIKEKEAMTRRLLLDMHRILNSAGGFMAVHCYQRLQEEATDLMKWSIPTPDTPKLELRTGTDWKLLGLQLIKKVSKPMEVTVNIAPKQSEGNKAEILLVKNHQSYEQFYRGLAFFSEDKIITWGVYRQLRGLSDVWGRRLLDHWHVRFNYHNQFFTETREGEMLSTQPCDSLVLQMLPYGNRLLMLTVDLKHYGWIDFRVRFQDTDTALYQFTDYYSCYYSHKLMAVTRNHQLIMLKKEAQTLHVVHLETRAEKDLSLRVLVKAVYSVMATSDNKLILLCVEEKVRKKSKLKKLLGKAEKEERHSVIKYDPQLQQVIWASDYLLTVNEVRLIDPLELLEEELLLRDGLLVAGHLDYLYVLSRDQPNKVFRISMSDGRVIQKIPCDGLPEHVWDIGMRGNTIATASDERVSFYEVTDITDIT